MKKLIFLILVVITMMSACNKPEPEFCWECQPVVETKSTTMEWRYNPTTGEREYVSVSTWNKTFGTKQTYCGMTESDINVLKETAKVETPTMRGKTICIKK